MKKVLLIISLILLSVALPAQGFKTEQQKATRVKIAYAEKWDDLKKEMTAKGIDPVGFSLFIRVFKSEGVLEAWVKPKGSSVFQLFKTYPVCATSGVLGPKRKQGDGQVPEGFYHIAAFNPYSNYYLSLGVSYPNESDKILGKGNLGGDIMIHGNCVTIGCIPITDPLIKELYVLAVEAKNNGQASIPVHIFPCKLDAKGWAALSSQEGNLPANVSLWKNLQEGYLLFEKNKILPSISVDKSGKYKFK